MKSAVTTRLDSHKGALIRSLFFPNSSGVSVSSSCCEYRKYHSCCDTEQTWSSKRVHILCIYILYTCMIANACAVSGLSGPRKTPARQTNSASSKPRCRHAHKSNPSCVSHMPWKDVLQKGHVVGHEHLPRCFGRHHSR